MMITTKLLSSLISVRPESCPDSPALESQKICRNESFSFQLAYKITDNSTHAQAFHVSITSDLPVSLYYIGCTPVLHTDLPCLEEKTSIGLYPDILIPRPSQPKIKRVQPGYANSPRFVEDGPQPSLWAYHDSWQALWLAVNEDGEVIPAGIHMVRIDLFDNANQVFASHTLELEVLNTELPQQALMYTNWFHCDCLADYYNVPVFSQQFFEIFADYVHKAARNGMNMILLPAFTPALDTPVGGERMTVQLVKIRKDPQGYHFDFSLMKKYMDICQENGIRYFEHAHLFTQWGAAAAPKIVVSEDGAEKRLFGWDTPSDGEAYREFLRAYIPALRQFLRQEGLEEKTLFHISDEPNQANLPTYQAALEGVRDLLKGCMVGDALSEYEYYEKGIVQTPIVALFRIQDFLGRCDNLWAYYIGSGLDLRERSSNRLIQISRQRNRMLGTQLYYHKIKGFLHWGYNYYYGELSQGIYEPALNPCGGFPGAATSFFVYPARDGTAYQSVRQKIFSEGLQDQRALELLEKLAGRAECEKLLQQFYGDVSFTHAPDSPETMLEFRQAVMAAIQENLSPTK